MVTIYRHSDIVYIRVLRETLREMRKMSWQKIGGYVYIQVLLLAMSIVVLNGAWL